MEINSLTESTDRSIWTAIRWQTMFIYNPEVKKQDRIKDPKKLGLFHWEKQEVKTTQTAEEVMHIFKALGGKWKNKKK